MLDQALKDFIERPVMQVIGSVGGDRRCNIGRGSGARVDLAGGRVHLAISAWQWPETVASLRANGTVALTFMNPLDYTSFQLKGQATMYAPDPADFEMAAWYLAETYRMMRAMGLPPISDGAFFSTRELWMASVLVEDVFIQTPGTLAGKCRGAACA